MTFEEVFRNDRLVLDAIEALRQVAGILSRTLRSGDFLARFAGDEFVIVLTDTGLAAAGDISDRMAAAVAGRHWESLAPGAPVTVTTGLAALDDQTPLTEAFRTADPLTLRPKDRHAPVRDPAISKHVQVMRFRRVDRDLWRF